MVAIYIEAMCGRAIYSFVICFWSRDLCSCAIRKSRDNEIARYV